MNRIEFMLLAAFSLCIPAAAMAQEIPVSEATQECLECHAMTHPGIVAGWQASRHAAITTEKAMQVQGLAAKVSSKTVSDDLKAVVVGCAECHTLRPKAHADTFDHNGYNIHVVVSPDDCRTCHATEADEYSRNVMAHAYANLADNKVYNQLEKSILGSRTLNKSRLEITAPDAGTRAESCYHCHGTVLKVSGTEVRDTELVGELEFPIIEGWPNQGVGRINLDGSKGACSACHTRHSFSIETARKPHTCKSCHVGPDVPAYKVYLASKHGNIYSSKKQEWDFKAVPWTVGEDFTAPTCATCHISLLVNTDGEVVNQRTHEMKNRLSWRIFGLIYAHPQPKSPDTTIIRNKDGLPLPTDFKGGFADKYLLSPDQQAANTKTMQSTCLACHDTSWVTGHWRQYNNTIKRTNAEILTLTQMMSEAWDKRYAGGLDQNQNPFDESIERIWSDAWLFYANTVRFASAMSGGGDFSVFADGRYQLSRTAMDMHAWLEQRRALEKLEAGKQ